MAEGGAVGHPQVQENLYVVCNHTKRLFDRASLLELFRGWEIDRMLEREILRYEKRKSVWELTLYAT